MNEIAFTAPEGDQESGCPGPEESLLGDEQLVDEQQQEADNKSQSSDPESQIPYQAPINETYGEISAISPKSI